MVALAPPPLLATQLSIPPLPRGIVDRPRLRAALERGLEDPFTLVCGPAGSGKTILTSSTLAEHDRPVAWVSLARGDDRPGRLAAAIRAALGSCGLAPDEAPLPLVDVLAGIEEPFVLVLDDVHVLRARRCLEQLSALVMHPPANLRLVLCSRSDPALPLHLPRLHGSLTEIRARELAFSEPEAHELLLEHGLDLDPELVETLCRRTEGWAAGLRLAALGLQHRSDPERFVADFAGDDRVVADYLVAEVLNSEKPRRRRFLLETSIAERLCGGLADAITGQDDGAETLEALERDNGFVVALDSHRGWYRMHRLFAELLRVHARRELGSELDDLHRRAAAWHAAAGEPADALRHAALGADWELAAELISAHWLELAARSEAETLHAVLADMPAEQRDADPRLAAVLACLELEAGAAECANRHLEHAAGGTVGGRWRARHLDTITLARVRMAQAEGRDEQARELVGELLAGASPRDGWAPPLRQAIAHLQLGVAGLWDPNPETAVDELRAAADLARAAALPGIALSALGHLALTQVLHTGPNAARGILEDAFDEPAARVACADAAAAYVAGAAVALYERRLEDSAASVAAARLALAAGENASLSGVLEAVAAELDAAGGDAESALRRLDVLALRSRATPCAPILAALRARILVEQLGAPERARAVLAAAPETAETLVAMGRLHLATGDPGAAVPALDQARSTTALLGATAVEAPLLAAVACEQLRDPAAADTALEDALALAGETGHRIMFHAAGSLLEPLLRRRIRRGTAQGDLVCELLQHRDAGIRSAAPPLEPLSEREAMILRYLPTTLSNREIANELFVTTNTVKTHLRSIYRKLGVAGRREAVERARALRLTG
ncbi:MAG TPA: LuxR C-terminal-related transcriptional regulator, partial [Solirubrobacter sp.]|nr:LuxR C-terminal-related transcriptional regulator [Solirubrobacter sp.]